MVERYAVSQYEQAAHLLPVRWQRIALRLPDWQKEQAEELYRGFGKAYLQSENWQLYLLSSHTEFERCFGKTADKKRKLYNGMIKCDLFMYFK